MPIEFPEPKLEHPSLLSKRTRNGAAGIGRWTSNSLVGGRGLHHRYLANSDAECANAKTPWQTNLDLQPRGMYGVESCDKLHGGADHCLDPSIVGADIGRLTNHAGLMAFP